MTIKPEILDAMVASGCTAEQIAAVVKASLGTGKSGAQRQAEYIERKKSERQVTGNDVTSVTADEDDRISLSSSPCPLDPPSQTHPPIIPQSSSPNPAAKRGTRLPDDWSLPASWGRWAQSEGYPEPMIRREAERFANFWQSKAGKDATKIDWEKTWRNWMLKFDRPRSPGFTPPKQTAFQQRHQSALDAFDRKLGLKPNDEFAGSHLDLEPADWRPH